MATLADERLRAVHLLRAGQTVSEVAKQLGHSEQWVRKWWRRYQSGDWAGLVERSRAPHRVPKRLSDEMRHKIVLARSELEAQAASGEGLKYVGGPAVRTKLKAQGCASLPSVASIERILQAADMTKSRCTAKKPEVIYPHIRPTDPQQLIQVDIVPHYLTGGTRVHCFNGIDVVSRCATGMALEDRRSQEASSFLVHTWQTLGIPDYTQVDNDSCFDGGHTHPSVLGHVVRFALAVGTELVFSPAYHPESNGCVERFHQEYNRHVWEDTYLSDLAVVKEQSDRFFSLYCTSGHHSALNSRTPQEVHGQSAYRLPKDYALQPGRLPFYEGRLHFIRQVLPDSTVSMLNIRWAVPNPEPFRGVWVTIDLCPSKATLSIYDAAPDTPSRRCLATYPFPVQEPILPRSEAAVGRPDSSLSQSPSQETESLQPALALHPETRPVVSIELLLRMLLGLARRTCRIADETMS